MFSVIIGIIVRFHVSFLFIICLGFIFLMFLMFFLLCCFSLIGLYSKTHIMSFLSILIHSISHSRKNLISFLEQAFRSLSFYLMLSLWWWRWWLCELPLISKGWRVVHCMCFHCLCLFVLSVVVCVKVWYEDWYVVASLLECVSGCWCVVDCLYTKKTQRKKEDHDVRWWVYQWTKGETKGQERSSLGEKIEVIKHIENMKEGAKVCVGGKGVLRLMEFCFYLLLFDLSHIQFSWVMDCEKWLGGFTGVQRERVEPLSDKEGRWRNFSSFHPSQTWFSCCCRWKGGGEGQVSFRWFVEFAPLPRLVWFVVVVVVILLISSEEREESRWVKEMLFLLLPLSFPSGDSSRKQDLGWSGPDGGWTCRTLTEIVIEFFFLVHLLRLLLHPCCCCWEERFQVESQDWRLNDWTGTSLLRCQTSFQWRTVDVLLENFLYFRLSHSWLLLEFPLVKLMLCGSSRFQFWCQDYFPVVSPFGDLCVVVV